MGSRFDDIRAATDDTILVQSLPVGWQHCHYRNLPGRWVDDFSCRVEEFGGRRVKEFDSRVDEFDSRVKEFDSRVEEFESQVEELVVVEWRNIAVEWMNLYFWATVDQSS